jgi:glutathione S-transferase
VKTWEALADGLIDASILARQEKHWPMRKDTERSEAWINRQMGKVHNSLKAMEKGLGDKVYCSGIHLSLADIAVGCALGYLDLRFEELQWRESYPELCRLYDKLSTRASFMETR